MESSNAVREYRLLSSALPEAQRRQFSLYLPQILVIVAVVLLSTAIAALRSTGTMLTVMLGLGIVCIVYVGAVAIPQMRKRLSRCWDTYVLEFGSDYLIRRQEDTPDIRINFSDIRRIQRFPGRYLRVIGATDHSVIGIPEGLENFEEVTEKLSEILPTSRQYRDKALRNTVVTGVGFATYLLMLWTQSPKVAVPFAVVVAGLLVWLFIFMQRSPNVTYRNKRISWLYLVFILICAIKVISVLSPSAH